MPFAAKTLFLLTGLWALACAARAQSPTLSQAWVPDLGNGMYKNPVLYADYSDPDVVRMGPDYYLTSPSFSSVPGLQILHSTDLVNWTIIGAARPVRLPRARYDQVPPGNGVWAPALRFHQGQLYLYYPDPDLGIFVVQATCRAVYGYHPAHFYAQSRRRKSGAGAEEPRLRLRGGHQPGRAIATGAGSLPEGRQRQCGSGLGARGGAGGASPCTCAGRGDRAPGASLATASMGGSLRRSALSFRHERANGWVLKWACFA